MRFLIDFGMVVMNFDANTFGHRLRHYRRRRGLTLDELSVLIGRPAPYLSMVENGKKEPRLGQIAAMAEALDVTLDDLLAPEAPNRRAELEIELERAQNDPSRSRPPLPPSFGPAQRRSIDASGRPLSPAERRSRAAPGHSRRGATGQR